MRDIRDILTSSLAGYPGQCPRHGAIVSLVPNAPCWRCDAERHARTDELEERAARLAAIRAAAKVPELYADASFENWRPVDGITPDQAAAAAKIRRFVERYALEFTARHKAGDFRGFGLWGRTGVGKTHLLCATVNTLAAAGIAARYTDLAALSARVRSTFGGNTGLTEAEVMGEFTRPKLLAIDEIGATGTAKGGVSEFEVKLLADVVTQRQNRKLPTIVAGNIPPDALADWVGDRAASRLRWNDSPMLTVDLPDYRLARH